MSRLRSFRRALLALLLGTAVLFSLVLAASQVEQRLFRRRAELLLAEIQSLELRKTPWHEAKAQLERWRANTEIGSRCSEQWCSQTITLNQFVFGYVSERNVFVRLDDYFRWRLNLSYSEGPFVKLEWALLRTYMRLGGRPARVVATAGMRNGIVWSKGYSVYIQTYTHNVPDFLGDSIGYALMAESHSVPRFDYYGANWVSPHLGFTRTTSLAVQVVVKYACMGGQSSLHMPIPRTFSDCSNWTFPVLPAGIPVLPKTTSCPPPGRSTWKNNLACRRFGTSSCVRRQS